MVPFEEGFVKIPLILPEHSQGKKGLDRRIVLSSVVKTGCAKQSELSGGLEVCT